MWPRTVESSPHGQDPQREVKKVVSLLWKGIDSGLSFDYNDKNVYVNVYVLQYTRFFRGNL
jgi:hypothetical protein